MSGVTVPVAAGRSSTQLTGAPLAKGTTIYNSDSTNSVWVSSSQSVSPGNGQLVGPLGTAEWNSDANAFACVDTGVTQPVSVIISGDVSSVTNPVAQAAATASILLAQGIPNVFQGSTITNVRLALPGVNSYTVVPDLSKYAGLSVNLNQIGNDQLITFTWLDAPGGNLVTQQTYLATALRMAGAGTGSNLELTVAVKSPTLRIDFSRGSMNNFFGTGIVIYASNRLPVETVGNIDLGIDYTLPAQAFVANTPVFLGNLTTNGGLHSVRYLTTGAGAGFFGFETCDGLGNLKNIYPVHTTPGQDLFGQVVLPRGALGLYFLTSVVATFVAEFSVVAGGN